MESEEAVVALEHFVWPLIVEYVPRLIGLIVALILARVAAGWLSGLTQRGLTRARADEALTKFLSNIVRWSVLAVGVVTALGYVGVETASFAAILAAGGLAIGLAFQGSLSNFAAGVMLLIFRPFRVGDYIHAAGTSGSVVAIEIFTTELKTPDAQRVIVPNSAVFGGTITNVTHYPERRVEVAVGTGYGVDLKRVRSVLEAVPAKVKAVLSEPAPQVFLAQLGESSVDWKVRVWAKGEDFWDVHQELTQRLKEALDEAAIEIPFPQRDLHVRAEALEALRR